MSRIVVSLDVIECVTASLCVGGRSLHKAESRMDKVGRALGEVDRKVQTLKKKFERTTTEAAKLNVELENAQEVITAAENLVGKLDGEYARWSGQVRGREGEGRELRGGEGWGVVGLITKSHFQL